ncbi:hypothetical protein Lser_V15G20944 [Lactuca serriola]
MGSILDFLKPICLFANRNKKNKHKKRHQNGQKQKDEKKEQLLKNNQLTLQDCILSSPSLNRSSPLPLATSSKRVHPNPSFVTENLSMETQTLLLGDHLNPLFEYDNNDDDDDEMGMGIKKTKKRVSFRTPEVADIFILTIESPELQDFQVI